MIVDHGFLIYKSIPNLVIFGMVQNRHLAPKSIQIDAKNKGKIKLQSPKSRFGAMAPDG